ncbi:hypothetical protein E1176_18155 [Fulvivirga sp. RKSG066]|uniref:hypothetical protein n=1 Tax=Fulvivirga aurantia TaxID=2529383 RepID=UPI0012BB5028|nr:hypothetical protein [Fulvivirga aurantia]MTI22959.1 hypothetical protein [Fulvivirga aurantia]
MFSRWLKIFLSTSFFCCIVSFGFAQSGLQNYTPSVLLLPGQWEFKNFHNYYTQTKQFGPNGGKVLTGRGRESYYTMINQFLYGVSDRVNIGFDVWLKAVDIEANPSANWTAISGVGPKIKILPTGVPGFSFQSTLLFPAAQDLEGDTDRAFLEHDRTLWINQFFYDRIVAPDFQVFAQFSIWYAFVRNSFRNNNYLQTPTSIFFSYLPTCKFTVYATTEFWPVHYDAALQEARAFHSFFLQAGVGIKYQLIEGHLELEFLYTNFVYGSLTEGAGETLNAGIRVLR